MKCDLCKIRDAVVHINTISNGIKTQLHLCKSCTKDIKIVDQNNIYYDDFLKAILSKTLDKSIDEKSNDLKQYKCLMCNTTYEEFKKTSKFGCANCYKTFEKDINVILKKINVSTTHEGKYPIRKFGYLKTKKELQKIREKLKIAILEEEYELAVKLRDKIRNMEKEINDE